MQDHFGRDVLPLARAVRAQPHRCGRGQLPVLAGGFHGALFVPAHPDVEGHAGRLGPGRGASIARNARRPRPALWGISCCNAVPCQGSAWRSERRG